MSEFKKEDRYIVIKRADVDRYLSGMEKSQLIGLCHEVAQSREREGKPNKCFVVVADDWPEYDLVWSMIEARVNDEASQ